MTLIAAALILGQATQPVYVLPDPPASWEKLIIAIAGLLTAAASLWALLKSQKAETKADATEQRQNNTAADVRNIQETQVKLATAIDPAAVSDTQRPPATYRPPNP